jgi:hypothetical protein
MVATSSFTVSAVPSEYAKAVAPGSARVIAGVVDERNALRVVTVEADSVRGR